MYGINNGNTGTTIGSIINGSISNITTSITNNTITVSQITLPIGSWIITGSVFLQQNNNEGVVWLSISNTSNTLNYNVCSSGDAYYYSGYSSSYYSASVSVTTFVCITSSNTYYLVIYNNASGYSYIPNSFYGQFSAIRIA